MLVHRSQFRSVWQKQCMFRRPESLLSLKLMCQLEVAFTQTPMRDRKNLFKRFIWSQNTHLNEHISEKCVFFSLDWDEISEQSFHVQPSTDQERESWCRYLLPSRRKLPIIFSIFSSCSGLCTVQKPCTTYTKLSASWRNPNRSTAADTFILAADPDPVFVLRSRACHVVRKPRRQHRQKDVQSCFCG